MDRSCSDRNGSTVHLTALSNAVLCWLRGLHRYGLPDESCANYVAEAAPLCDQQAICANCMPIGEAIFPYRCWAVPSPILYYVHEYGQVHGEAAMMSEIYARGPITCGFASVDDFDYAYVSRTQHCNTPQTHTLRAHRLHRVRVCVCLDG